MISMTTDKDSVLIRIPKSMLKAKPYEFMGKDGETKRGVRYIDTSRWGAQQVGKASNGDPIVFGCFLKSITGGKAESPAADFTGF